jgi:hypothetical protein
MTVLQPVLRLVRFLSMHAVTFATFGISELQRRIASPEHICWASRLKAKLEVDDTAETETMKAKITPARRVALLNAFIASPFVSRWSRRVVDAPTLPRRGRAHCDLCHLICFADVFQRKDGANYQGPGLDDIRHYAGSWPDPHDLDDAHFAWRSSWVNRVLNQISAFATSSRHGFVSASKRLCGLMGLEPRWSAEGSTRC